MQQGHQFFLPNCWFFPQKNPPKSLSDAWVVGFYSPEIFFSVSV